MNTGYERIREVEAKRTVPMEEVAQAVMLFRFVKLRFPQGFVLYSIRVSSASISG